jgi:hypothetical protein
MTAAAEKKAIAAIERRGVLLVYPITNRRDPPSLWFELHPKSEMRWSWDEGADPRVVQLWHLRERIARSRAVVYSKWFKNRAVFFKKPLFEAMLAKLHATGRLLEDLPQEAAELLSLLEEDSPISTKELRKRAGLQGKLLERPWTKALSELFARCLIVGTGEVADGAFPSLAVGATRWIFEDLWLAAREGVTAEHEALIAEYLPEGSAFGKEWKKILGRHIVPLHIHADTTGSVGLVHLPPSHSYEMHSSCAEHIAPSAPSDTHLESSQRAVKPHE